MFSQDRVNYILRTYLEPEKLETRIEEMIRFCHETGTRYVMLLTDAQYLVWNQLTLDAARCVTKHLEHDGRRFEAEGSRFGINSSYAQSKSRWEHCWYRDYDCWSTPLSSNCEFRNPCLLDPKLEK